MAGSATRAGGWEGALAALSVRVRALRLERGLRLADVARLSGLSEAHISRVEQGERWPSVQVLLTLARVYGVDPSLLLARPEQDEMTKRRRSAATWRGTEAEGAGVMLTRSIRVHYDRASRLALEQGDSSLGSPEELIGMAYAGCFSMSLARQLEAAGFEPQTIDTSADVCLSVSAEGNSISEIRLSCEADVPRIEPARFREIAEITKRICVVGRALLAVPVAMDARLTNRGAKRKKGARR
jgi:osmotically inducible protein OsmC